MKRRALGISASLALALTACGGGDDGGGGAGEFTAICERVDEELDDLDDPTSVADASSNAKKIADLMEDATDDMEKVKLGDGDTDAEDLIDNFKDQIDSLDELIAIAAAQSDSAGLQATIDALAGLQDDAADLSKDAGARKCALKAVVDLVTPPDDGIIDATTVPVDTVLPVVDTTAPPVETTPPVNPDQLGDGTRVAVDLAATLVSIDGSVFNDVPTADLIPFDTLLGLTSTTAASTGSVAGIDVIDPNGVFLGRAFVFLPDVELPGTVQADLLVAFDGQGVGVPAVFGPDSGTLLLRNGGAEFLVGSAEAVVWILGRDEASIRAAYVILTSAVGG